MNISRPNVSLFIPCLVDQVYPEIGMAMAKVLRYFGYNLQYHQQQTCCGQPAFNAGHRKEARVVAEHFIDVFYNDSLIVAPSGSCVAMVRNYYPTLFQGHEYEEKAGQISNKVFEFSEFMDREGLINKIAGSFTGRVGFHNSCHSYRELGIEEEPFKIFDRITGFQLLQPQGESICCGFGGLFSFKFDEIAAAMANTRLGMFTSIGVNTIVSNDPGCIMHLRQEAKDRDIDIEIIHLTEFLVMAMDLK
jgi:L-lactate dehydrogenase complex protein LldE